MSGWGQIDVLALLGGRRGIVDAVTPGIVLVAVDIFAPLGWAIVAALGAAAVLAATRLAMGQTLRQTGFGIVGVAGAAALAAVTGDAKNYFLPGIILNAVYAVLAVVSIAVRRPALGYAAAFLDRGYSHWQEDRGLFRVTVVATAMWAAVFASRACVQGYLYVHDDVHWLAPVRLGMGLPLWGLALSATLLLLDSRRRVAEEA
jgi:hypothetical protein